MLIIITATNYATIKFVATMNWSLSSEMSILSLHPSSATHPIEPKRPHEHKDLTFWFQGPTSGGHHK